MAQNRNTETNKKYASTSRSDIYAEKYSDFLFKISRGNLPSKDIMMIISDELCPGVNRLHLTRTEETYDKPRRGFANG